MCKKEQSSEWGGGEVIRAMTGWSGGTDPLTKIQGSDTWVLLDTQKTQRFLRVNPPENVAIKTRQKTHPKPNCTVLISNIFYYFEF